MRYNQFGTPSTVNFMITRETRSVLWSRRIYGQILTTQSARPLPRKNIIAQQYQWQAGLFSSGCTYDDRVYAEGEVWHPEVCKICQCSNGEATCKDEVCPEPNCLDAVAVEGSCCPICPGKLVGSSKKKTPSQ